MIEERFIFKVIIIGEYAVGKTSLLNKYVDKSFSFDYKPTMGANIMTKDFSLPEKKSLVKFSFWDIAAQDSSKGLRQLFFQGANGILLVYDVTREKTFEALPKWISECKRCELDCGSDETPGVLIGNKTDLPKKVPSTRGKEYAKKINFKFIETSALKDENVNDAFQFILDTLLP